MGHRLLGQLPATRNWQKVIALLEATDDPAKIADATSQAAKRGLDLAKRDLGVADTVYMLMKLVWSARSENFRQELSNLGISIPESLKAFHFPCSYRIGWKCWMTIASLRLNRAHCCKSKRLMRRSPE
jgi:hypothetical protein